jgi:glycosyltransferase involved in cell wall biosynthesis
MERYADELERALVQIGCPARSYVAARPLPQLRGGLNTAANYAWRSTVYPLAARLQQGDVNHIVDHSYAHLIHALDARRTIVTCHDLAPLALNEGRGIGRRLWERSFRAMRRAARIIADSEFTRAEILRHSDYPAARLTVVPLAVGAEFFNPVPDAAVHALRDQFHLQGRRVILHVGSCTPRKNIETLLHAVSLLQDPADFFVQIGGRFTAAQTALLDTLHFQERVLQIAWVAEDGLRGLYRAADVFVLPSLYEGFGLPILEALASGAPVVCSDLELFREIGGAAALFVDPRDPAALAAAIARVCDEPKLARQMRARGLEQARAFTWERCARQVFQVYEQVVEQNEGNR